MLDQLASPYDSSAWFPRNSLGRLYRRQLELAQQVMQPDAAIDSANRSDVSQARLRLLTWLIEQRQDAEAQSLFNTLPATETSAGLRSNRRSCCSQHISPVSLHYSQASTPTPVLRLRLS